MLSIELFSLVWTKIYSVYCIVKLGKAVGGYCMHALCVLSIKMTACCTFDKRHIKVNKTNEIAYRVIWSLFYSSVRLDLWDVLLSVVLRTKSDHSISSWPGLWCHHTGCQFPDARAHNWIPGILSSGFHELLCALRPAPIAQDTEVTNVCYTQENSQRFDLHKIRQLL